VKSSKKKVPYPFYTLEDVNYSKFIIRLLSYMYTRQFEPGELIAREMIESGEIIFVEKGIYNIGYEIKNSCVANSVPRPTLVATKFRLTAVSNSTTVLGPK
jgi:hypothetical protein